MMIAKLAAYMAAGAFVLSLASDPASGSELADCPRQWISGGPIPGIDGYVSQIIPWDRDGQGPMGTDLLVFGGSIVVDQVVPGAAVWDGTHWEGFPHPGYSIFDWVIRDGQLVVGGQDWPYGRVSRWTGTEWETLPTLNSSGPVRAVEVFRGEIIAGGGDYFGNTSGNSFIRRFRGTYWDTLGQGISGHPVDALEIYNDELVAAGRFSSSGGTPLYGVARWNGVNWASLGTGISGTSGYPITDFLLMDGYLVVAGRFNMAGGNPASNIARWDGNSWSAFSGNPGFVTAMAMHEGELYVGNWTKTDGGYYDTGRVRRWTGSSWVIEGSDFVGGIGALSSYHGRLYAGGIFTVNGSGQPSLNFTALSITGSGWDTIGSGLNGPINSFSEYQGRLIAGGRFLASNGITTNRVAERIGSTWQPLGFGMNEEVLALQTHANKLVAAGYFTMAGGVTANRIAQWNGQSWQPMGTGFDATVRVMTEFQGDLIVGGDFDVADGMQTSRLARWNGLSWTPLGTGVDNGIGHVQALCEYQGDLYAGGSFDSVGGVFSPSIAKWNGSQWSQVPFPLGFLFTNGYVTALCVHDEKLFAVLDNNTFAEWDGSQWTYLGASDPYQQQTIGSVFAILSSGDRLYAVGEVGSNGVYATLAYFEGVQWDFEFAFPPRDDQEVYAIREYDNSLVLGGNFRIVNNEVSGFFAQWQQTGPRFEFQPTVSSTCPGTDVFLSATVSGAVNPAYQWKKDGSDLSDGANVQGSNSTTLQLLSVDLSDDGAYHLVVTDECGIAESIPAELTVACCTSRPNGDANRDRVVDALDIQFFVETIMEENRTAARVCPSDFNHDRKLDVEDVEGFVNALLSAP